MKDTMKLKFRKIHPEAKSPEYQTKGSAGLDLCACVPYEIFLQRGVRFTCPTGIAMDIPDGFEGQVRPRSGLAHKKGLTVLNSPGTIDSDFRGEICVILINHGDQVISINSGDRIAQLVIAPVMRVELVQAGDLSSTERGEGGFGSTGS